MSVPKMNSPIPLIIRLSSFVNVFLDMNSDNLVITEKGLFYNVMVHQEADKFELSMNRHCLCFPGTGNRSWI